MSPVDLSLVAIGAAFGACLRHLVGIAMVRVFGLEFPWGTFTVNMAGSFLMGLVFAALLREELAGVVHHTRLVAATGFLGGFTTFSAFSLEVFWLIERGEGMAAAAYVAGSVVLGVLACAAGIVLVRGLPG